MKELLDNYLLEIATAIVGALTAFLGYGVTILKNKMTEEINDREMHHIIENVVKYVEQKAVTGSNMKSEEKKALAIEKAQEWLTSKGISISETELEILIEAAVQGLQGGKNGAKSK